jgi:2-keto-myo-inositol isomerase
LSKSRIRPSLWGRALRQAGYDGTISFEAFSPTVHALADPKSAIAESMAFIDARLSEKAA